MSAEWERALADLDAYSTTVTGSITLSAFSTAASILLPQTMRALNEEFPHLATQTIEAEPSECYDLLLAGDVDLGIVAVTTDTPAGSDDRFAQQFLIDDPLDLMVPLDHHLADRSSVSIADAREETWILGRPGTTYHQLVIANCASAGFTPRIGHYANDWNTGTALVHDGFGVCVASRLYAFTRSAPGAALRWAQANAPDPSHRRGHSGGSPGPADDPLRSRPPDP